MDIIHYRATRGSLTQNLLRTDLQDPKTLDLYRRILPDAVQTVYSDPPWNPGNASYWRTHAGLEACASYNAFLDAWIAVVVEAISRGAQDVCTEQSIKKEHCDMLLKRIEANPGWTLPLLERWKVYYGSPNSAGCRLPNELLHFGKTPLLTDPEGMRAEPMTIRVCAGLKLQPGATLVDPCMGKGMSSRMAHYFGMNCVGSELNPKRLAVTLEWLRGQGYTVEEVR